MRLIEFQNPHPHEVHLIGPDRRVIPVAGHAKVVLSEWFADRYVPKFLKIVRVIGEETRRPAPPSKPRAGIRMPTQPLRRNQVDIKSRAKSGQKRVVSRLPIQPIRPNAPTQTITTPPRNRPIPTKKKQIVGHRAAGDPKQYFKQALEEADYPISNNIGVGILSYNRLGSLQRLIESIRNFTDLTRTTVFVSDESSNEDVKQWLREQPDIVVLDNSTRLGVAGNTNRLLRCLSRFRYKLILNDDVEVKQYGWDHFYFEAMAKTGYHHFCFREPGIYAATERDGVVKQVNGLSIRTIQDKPQGSIMALDDMAFEKVGYFDEQFGYYGMEHVDWSRRVSRAKIQPEGYHDVEDADAFFKIWAENSAVDRRGELLASANTIFNKVSGDAGRIYVNPSPSSSVPAISYVVPFRNVGRGDSIATVVANIKAQRFPQIEIIIIEQDQKQAFDLNTVTPIRHRLVPTNDQFNKSLAFNSGVAWATNNKIVLQDADIMNPGEYTMMVSKMLDDSESCHLGQQVLYLTADSSRKVYTNGVASADLQCESAVDYFEGGSIGITKSAYVKIGGFDERFVGYGVEDVEFYERLKNLTNHRENRVVKMIHLWHGRVDGWQSRHQVNKLYYSELQRSPIQLRAQTLNGLLTKRHGL